MKQLRKYKWWLVAFVVIIGGSYVNNRILEADGLKINGYYISAIENTLDSDDSTILPSQAAVKAAIDAVSISSGNAMNALNIEDYDAVEGSSSSGSKTPTPTPPWP